MNDYENIPNDFSTMASATGTMMMEEDGNENIADEDYLDKMTMITDEPFQQGDDVEGLEVDDGDDGPMMMALLDDGPIVDEATEDALESIAGLYSKNNNSNTRQVSDSTHESALTTSSQKVGSATLHNHNTNSNDGIPESASNRMTTELPLVLTGRLPIRLYLSCNPDYLSPYQCLIRKHVELFEAKECDVTSPKKGRNKSIVLGQVGIRCCFCGYVPPTERDRGNMYFPSNLSLIYQAAQILSQEHLMGSCRFVPPDVRQQLIELRQQKNTASMGKEYWAKTAQVLGVYEDQFGLRFEKKMGYIQH